MIAPGDLSSADRRHFYRRAALAPVCLCLVAALHAVRVWTAQQTPWKGGGFGMFSTVDAESARFLRCYLITDEGELPLPLPPSLDKAIAEQRAAPSQTGLDELARRLTGQPWRWRDQRQQREAVTIADCEGIAISAASLRLASSLPLRSESAATESRATPGGEHRLEPIPLHEPTGKAIPILAVRVECWRYRFEAASGELKAEKMLASTHRSQVVPPGGSLTRSVRTTVEDAP